MNSEIKPGIERQVNEFVHQMGQSAEFYRQAIFHLAEERIFQEMQTDHQSVVNDSDARLPFRKRIWRQTRKFCKTILSTIHQNQSQKRRSIPTIECNVIDLPPLTDCRNQGFDGEYSQFFAKSCR